ncbi:MAG: helix-turn-helix transcriptional regulator [Anaerolineales bacterium]|jgi:DNA-binding PadR family transcriptional regulator
MPEDIQSNLPLTEGTYFILLSLSPRPKHGYAIIKNVRNLSRERVNLSTGTLYGAIKRLLEQGWILRIDDPDSNGSRRKRKVYRLTSLGRRVLQAEVSRLDSLVAAAELSAIGKNV